MITTLKQELISRAKSNAIIDHICITLVEMADNQVCDKYPYNKKDIIRDHKGNVYRMFHHKCSYSLIASNNFQDLGKVNVRLFFQLVTKDASLAKLVREAKKFVVDRGYTSSCISDNTPEVVCCNYMVGVETIISGAMNLDLTLKSAYW